MTLLIISIILFAITNYFNLDTLKTILPIFDGIISAAIVAILLDIANEEREKEKLKIEYFNELNFRLSLLIGHIIWFDKYKDAEFNNWNNNIESFTDIKFIIYTSQFYESEKITFEEAVYKLEKLIKKYDLENYSMLPDSQKETI